MWRRSSRQIDGTGVHSFAALPARVVVTELSNKRMKREYELGVYAELRHRQHQFDEAWLRAAANQWLMPRKQSQESDAPRAARGLGVGSIELLPLAIASCKVPGAAAILVRVVNALIAAADWQELALILRQIEAWHGSMHRDGVERPWWELMASVGDGVTEAVDLAAREAPGGPDAPLDVTTTEFEVEVAVKKEEDVLETSPVAEASSDRRIYFFGCFLAGDGNDDPFGNLEMLWGHLDCKTVTDGFEVEGLFTNSVLDRDDGTGPLIHQIRGELSSVGSADGRILTLRTTFTSKKHDDARDGDDAMILLRSLVNDELQDFLFKGPPNPKRLIDLRGQWCSTIDCHGEPSGTGLCTLKLGRVERSVLEERHGKWDMLGSIGRDASGQQPSGMEIRAGPHPSLWSDEEMPSLATCEVWPAPDLEQYKRAHPAGGSLFSLEPGQTYGL